MGESIRTRRLIGMGLLLLAAAACSGASDPATDEPVELQPGLYTISVTQKAGNVSGQEKAPKPICVRASETEAFPHKLATEYFAGSSGCRSERAPREGNRISGEVVCAADRKMAEGSTKFVYAGAVAAGRIRLEGNMVLDVKVLESAIGPEINEAQLKKAMKRLEDVKTVIDGQRISDCP